MTRTALRPAERRLCRAAVLATLAITAYVAMGEIDRIVSAVTIGGRSYSAASTFGPWAVGGAGAPFDAWGTALAEVPGLFKALIGYCIASGVFVAAAIALLFVLWPTAGVKRRSVVFAVVGVAAAQLGLAVALVLAAAGHADSVRMTSRPQITAPEPLHTDFWPRMLIMALNIVTGLKIAALVIVAIVLLISLWVQPQGAAAPTPTRLRLVRVARAVKTQRYSAVVLVFLAALMIMPGKDIADQVPDVERSWVSHGWRIDWHLWIALACQALLVLLLLLVARMRDVRAVTKYKAVRPPDEDGGADDHGENGADGTQADGDAPAERGFRRLVGLLLRPSARFRTSMAEHGSSPQARTDSASRPWLVAAAVVALAAVAARLTGFAHLEWWHTAALCGVPVIVVVLSAVAKRWGASQCRRRAEIWAVKDAQARADDPDPWSDVRYACYLGDLLAIAALALFGISLVRSFLGLAILGGPGAGPAWVALAIGVVLAVAAWAVFVVDLRHAGFDELRVARDPVGTLLGSPIVETALAAAAVMTVASIGLLLWPLDVSKALGVYGTTVVALGVGTFVLGLLAYRAQLVEPLPVFTFLGLRSTPFISLVLLVGVLPGLLGHLGFTTQLHGIRRPAHPLTDNRQALTAVVNDWLADPRTAQCAVPLQQDGGPVEVAGRPVKIAPLVLVAAAGGGIRAAWWTVHGLSVLDSTPCRQHSVLLTSGVSGGSVGLAVTAFSPDPIAAVERLADPPGLAGAADGLLVRDVFSAFTGLDVFAVDPPDGANYPDRAALMEQVWERAAPGLKTAFPSTDDQRRVPWRVIMNSTSVRTKCRVLIADVRTELDDVDARNPQDCSLGSPQAAAGSYDLFDALPCLRGIRASTAAMLSARFAYITPSGVLPGCDGNAIDIHAQTDQLIDGGYDEASGIGTLVDLAPRYMPLVRAHNRAAISAGTGPIVLVMPTIVYLDNHIRADPPIGPPPYVQRSEALVPSYLLTSGGGVLNTSETLLQRAITVTSSWLDCTPSDSDCLRLHSRAQQGLPDQVILVAPRVGPQVAAPLGWVLSRASRDTLGTRDADGELTGQIRDQQRLVCGAHVTNIRNCPAGIGGFGDLLAWLGTG